MDDNLFISHYGNTQRKKDNTNKNKSKQDIVHQPAPLFHTFPGNKEFRFSVEKEKHATQRDQGKTYPYSVGIKYHGNVAKEKVNITRAYARGIKTIVQASLVQNLPCLDIRCIS